MLAYRHVRPSRCAYGANVTTDATGNTQFISLFNEISSAYVLAVHDFALKPITGSATAFGFVVDQGQLGADPVQGMPVVSNRQPMAGQVSQGEVTTLPTIQLWPPSPTTQVWPHDFPFIVLTPGWSLTAYALSTDILFGFSFWWQVLTPEELDELYGIDVRVA